MKASRAFYSVGRGMVTTNTYRFKFRDQKKCRKYSRQRTHKKLCSVSWVFVVKKSNSEIQE